MNEDFVLPIGPNKELGELFATSVGAKLGDYSLVLAYKKAPNPLLNSTFSPGPAYRFRNFPIDNYKKFVRKAGLDSVQETELSELIKEMFSQGFVCEEVRIPQLAGNALFPDGSGLGYVTPDPSSVTASTAPLPSNGDAERADQQSAATTNSLASTTHSGPASDPDTILEDDENPQIQVDVQHSPWWEQYIIPSFFQSIKNE